MSLATLVSHSLSSPKRTVEYLIIADTDGSGVAFAAARARLLAQRRSVAVVSRFGRDWATRPSVDLLRPALERIAEAFDPINAELIDIAVDNDHPMEWVNVVTRFAEETRARVAVYDAHPSTRAAVQELIARGIFVVAASNNADIAEALGLVAGDEGTRTLAITAIVCDRDPSALRYASREELENKYLPLANAMDVVVRQPQLLTGEPGIAYMGDQGRVAAILAEEPARLVDLARTVDYPPARLAKEAAEVVEVGAVAVLARIDARRAAGWVPKTMEQLALMHRRDATVAVVHGVDRRSGREYWDVQVIRYWLSPLPEQHFERIIAELAQQHGTTWRFSGGYGSVRFYDRDAAERAARYAFERIEGLRSSVAHLVSDATVAAAVQRDYQRIIEFLERIATALERGAAAKEEQVSLLRELYQRDERTRYD